MFGRLLTPLVTPLVSRFDLSPRPEVTFESNEDRETTSAENFARDVMIEVMRNSVATLKEAESLKGKIEARFKITSLKLNAEMLLINSGYERNPSYHGGRVLHERCFSRVGRLSAFGECAGYIASVLGAGRV